MEVGGTPIEQAITWGRLAAAYRQCGDLDPACRPGMYRLARASSERANLALSQLCAGLGAFGRDGEHALEP